MSQLGSGGRPSRAKKGSGQQCGYLQMDPFWVRGVSEKIFKGGGGRGGFRV